MEHKPHCSPGMSYEDSSVGRPQYHELQPAPFLPSGHHRNPNHLSVQTESHFRVAEWQHPYDSGVHSLQQSQATSVLSSMAPASRMSVVSVADTVDLTDQQRQKFENIPLSFHSAGPETASKAIPQLIELINDEDEAVAVRALGIIQNTARRDADSKFQKPIIDQPEAVAAIVEVLGERENQPSIVRVALGTLFHISGRPDGAHLVFSTNEILGGILVRRIIGFISNPAMNVQKWAIPLLHTLLCDSKRSGPNIKIAKEARAMEVLVYRLIHEVTEKLLSVIVQTINILVSKDNQQAKIFLSTGGAARLVYILTNFSYEGLLVGTTRLLNKLTPFAADLVAVDAPLAASRALSHASPRLVELSLECLRSLSHVQAMQHQTEVVQNVIRLLGVNRIKLVQHSVDVLSNMCANGRQNKEVICRGQAHQYFLRVLEEQLFAGEDLKKREELHESIIILLRFLCHDHYFAAEVQRNVMESWSTFLKILFDLRPKLLRLTLQLLLKVAANDHNLQTFQEAKSAKESERRFTGFPDEIVNVLKLACNHWPNPEVDFVRTVDIIGPCLEVLQSICRSPAIMDQVAMLFMNPANMVKNEFLPVYILQQSYGKPEDDRSLKTGALSLLAITSNNRQVAETFNRTAHLMNGLQELKTHENPEFAQLAEKVFYAINMAMGSSQYPPLRCAPSQERRYPPQRPSSPCEDQWPEDLANLTVADDPFVNVFCPQTSAPHNSPPFSPHLPAPSSVHAQPMPRYDSAMPSYLPDYYPPAPPVPPQTHHPHYGSHSYYPPPHQPYPPSGYNHGYDPSYGYPPS